MPLSPNLSAEQKRAASGSFPPVPNVCLVTGGTGFVGQRVVEMLVERGAKRVISFDIVPKPKDAWDHPSIEWRVGDITKKEDLVAACKGVDCVWHIAAAVGPFHPQELYLRVNYQGTLNVIDACKANNVPKLVMSSSPSTRFDGSDIDGLTEDEMPKLPLASYLQDYAETKAMGELAVREANCPELLTVAVAPHQVYGPRDNLFTPNILEAGASGMLRIFAHPRTGNGLNRVCFTHVDNYAHGLIIAERALVKGGVACGKFYIVTDGATHTFKDGYVHFWEVVDQLVVFMGFESIWQKYKLPYWFIMPVAHACNGVGWLLGRKLKLNPFNVKVLTMHRWFRITAAENELKFKPIIGFAEGWADSCQWFKDNWMPKFQRSSGLVGLAKQTERKIDIQAGKAQE